MMIWILVKPDAFVEDREEARMGAAGRAAEATVAGESNTDGNEGDDLDAAEDEYEDDDEEFGDD
jgi:hypothetical protein